MKLTATSCEYVNEVFSCFTEITGILFGFNALTMETLKVIVNIVK